MKPFYFYAVYLEDRSFVTEFTSTNVPPDPGDVIPLKVKGISGTYKVLDVKFKPISGVEIVVLFVKPAIQ